MKVLINVDGQIIGVDIVLEETNEHGIKRFISATNNIFESDEFIALDVEGNALVGDYIIEGKLHKNTAVPQTITKLQAMKQMKVIGKWEVFKTVLANDEDVNDEWVLSDNLNRTYPLVLGIGQLFGFTDEDMDNFFIEANKLS